MKRPCYEPGINLAALLLKLARLVPLILAALALSAIHGCSATAGYPPLPEGPFSIEARCATMILTGSMPRFAIPQCGAQVAAQLRSLPARP